ncbi:hypothetical protein THAOC_26603, partial [Thalassiosira oceanica]
MPALPTRRGTLCPAARARHGHQALSADTDGAKRFTRLSFVFAGIRRHEGVRSGERAAESPPSTSTSTPPPDERTNLRTVAAFQVRPGGQADVITSTSASEPIASHKFLLPFFFPTWPSCRAPGTGPPARQAQGPR